MGEEHPNRDDASQKTVPDDAPDQHEGPFVAGVGASAGGVEALTHFFEHMPADSGLAFVVIQHLSPDTKSLMPELLARHTEMPLHRVEDGMPVEPNHVYLIPPRHNMTIEDGRLKLLEQDRSHGLNLPIDIFLRALAEDFGQRAVGVILSGTGSDGMRGVRAIKEAGGMVMAQDEASAKFDGMPRSAISTGLVDFILPPQQMAQELVRFIKHPYVAKKPTAEPRILSDEDTLANILSVLCANTGVDFSNYKLSTVVRRIERRMSITQIDRLDQYLSYLHQYPREAQTLFKELLIGVTKFFRDSDAFAVVQRKAIPAIFDAHRKDASIRVWTPGCSTGEEAYSLAMLFLEEMSKQDRLFDIKIFATDIDRGAIEFAGRGMYPESVAADLSRDRINRFFVKHGGNYQVCRQIREMVIFAPHNIAKDPPFARLDLITCRNLLIYLQPGLQRKILALFQFSLKPNGFLFLGTSETVLDFADKYATIDGKWRVYQNRGPGGRPTLSESFSEDPMRTARTLPAGAAGGVRPTPRVQSEADRLIEAVYERLVEEYVPASVLVNANNEIVHIFGDVNAFVRVPRGRATLDLLKLADKELSAAMATAMHKARKDGRTVVYRDIRLAPRNGGERVTATLTVRPAASGGNGDDAVLVSLESAAAPRTPHVEGETFSVDQNTKQRMADLEHELQYTKENLQATIEELETSNEELQATNEELLAANEELQTTNEELQSVNEELHTLNAEYQVKIHELTQLNNDMDNLLRSTQVGTVFLDRDFRIRKYTPAVAEVFNILPQDVGRPLEHLAHDVGGVRLVDLAREVMQSDKPVSRDVQGPKGQWLLMRVLPYHEETGQANGTVITFTSIETLRETQDTLRRERDLLSRIMETSPSGITVVNANGEITFANPQAERVLKLERADITARTYDDPGWRITDYQGLPVQPADLPFSQVMETGEPVYGYRHAITDAAGAQRFLRINAAPLKDEQGRVEAVVNTIEDVSTLQAAHAQIDYLAPFQHAVVALDMQFKPVYWGANAERMFGWTQQELKKEGVPCAMGVDDFEAVRAAILAELENEARWEQELLLSRKNGSRFRGRLVCSKAAVTRQKRILFIEVFHLSEASSGEDAAGQAPPS